MESSPARYKRAGSQLDRLNSSSFSPKPKPSSPRSAKRQKNNNGTYSAVQLAKQGWASVAAMFSPAPANRAGSSNQFKPSSGQFVGFGDASDSPSAKLRPKQSSSYPHPSRQPSQTSQPRSLINPTPVRASASSVGPAFQPQLSSRSIQGLRTPTQPQLRALSPIQISSSGKVSKVGGGANTSASSVEYPEADEEDYPTEQGWAKQAAQPKNRVNNYHKKTPMGKNKHKQLLGNRDKVDLESLAHQAGQISLSMPTGRDRGSQALAGDPVTPPEQQKITKAELEARVGKVDGYLTPSALLSNRRLEGVANLLRSRHHDPARLNQLFARFKQERETVPPKVEYFTYDKIRAKELEEEKELEQRLSAKKRRAFPVRLLPEEKDVVDDAMANPKFNSSIFGGEVANRDLRRLRPGTWLNDEVITFYSCMINERAKPVREGTKLSEGVERLNLLNAYSVSSFWYGKLSNEGWTKPLSRWTKKVPDVFGLDVLVVPINLGNSHWVCGAINFKQKRIEYFDSLGGHNPSVFPRLREFLEGEHQFKKKAPMDFTGWEDFFDEEVPKQSNGCDCGVFTCQFMESLSRDAGGFDFEQKNMPYLRDKMVLEIAEQRLIVEPWA